MTIGVRARLSLMMFLQYFVWGAWYVTAGTWFGTTLHFTGEQIGWAMGTTALGAIISPFLAGAVADRSIATQKALSILHGLGAGFLLLASWQRTYGPLYFAVLAYAICYMPTLALTNALAFRQMHDTRKEFGFIRMFGTLGWIAAGLLIGSLAIEATATPLRIAAAASLVLAVYCVSLPHTPPLARGPGTGHPVIPRKAFSLLRERSMAAFVLASLLLCVPLQFYYAFTNLFLNETGVTNAAGRMSAGQMSELLCMLLIPWFFRCLGVKYMLAAGMAAWVLRYILFAYGNGSDLMWMVWAGILLHGICYDFFFVTGQIYIDRKAPQDLRAATQGLITLITYGLGMLIGSWLSGWVVDAYRFRSAAGLQHQWQSVWLVAAGASGAILLFFLATFRDAESVSRADGSASPVTSRR